MIDLHSHILPEIDDGPESLEKSTQMAELYVKYGFTHVVATPHWMSGTLWAVSKETIFDSITQLRHALESKSININILAGMEIALDIGLVDLLVGKRLLTLAGGSYVLIESPFQRLPLGWQQVIFQIMAKGFRVVLAHPERCHHFYMEPDLLHSFIEAGGYLQANYDSFLGHYGTEATNTAFSLLEKGYLHLLATDSHDTEYRHPGNALKALEILNKTADAETVEILTRINPQRVITGLPLKTTTPAIPLSKKRKKWWFF